MKSCSKKQEGKREERERERREKTFLICGVSYRYPPPPPPGRPPPFLFYPPLIGAIPSSVLQLRNK